MKTKTGIHEGELKPLPCPFCGGEVIVFAGSDQSLLMCKCVNCGGKGGERTRKINAIKAWNRRADSHE